MAEWTRYLNEVVAAEISTLSRYCDCLVHYKPRPEDSPHLARRIDCPQKQIVTSLEEFPDVSTEPAATTAVLLNGTFNYDNDIQGLLQGLKPKLARSSRIIAVLYNPYLRFLYQLASRLGFRTAQVPPTFITRADLTNLAALSGFEVVRIRPVAYCPWRLLGAGSLVNRAMPAVPWLRWLGFASVVTLRPIVPVSTRKPSLSIVIPARNERGNIGPAIERLPDLGADVEVLFVEGHSTDGTWEEIERVARGSTRFQIKALRQTGSGKADAVRLGLQHATGDLLTILDADLTTPPELLGRFYEAYCAGLADFINGTRLVYAMERDAMRFANRLGNIFFAKAVSFVLDSRLGDSLCGTKLVSRRDYERFVRWRADFGDLDPFGDFELLFPAAVLGLGIVDIPIQYAARRYGATNISRFSHGFMLLKMTLIGLLRIKCGVPAARTLSSD
jgi:glycosyl transferase family 2